MRHGPRSTWSSTSTDVPISCFRRRREGPSRSLCASLKRVEENRQGTEKNHIYRVDFRWILDAQGTSPTRRRSEETQRWWPLWSVPPYRVFTRNDVDHYVAHLVRTRYGKTVFRSWRRHSPIVPSEQGSKLLHGDDNCSHFDELRISTERLTLENSFCHFFLAHERAINEDPIGAGMYGRPSSFRGSLDRESCSHHTFWHSFLREWFLFHSSHYIIASSCASYWSVIVVCIWIEHSSWTVATRTCWGDQHSQDLKHVLQSCFHVKDVGSMWWGEACSAQDTRTEKG